MYASSPPWSRRKTPCATPASQTGQPGCTCTAGSWMGTQCMPWACRLRVEREASTGVSTPSEEGPSSAARPPLKKPRAAPTSARRWPHPAKLRTDPTAPAPFPQRPLLAARPHQIDRRAAPLHESGHELWLVPHGVKCEDPVLQHVVDVTAATRQARTHAHKPACTPLRGQAGLPLTTNRAILLPPGPLGAVWRRPGGAHGRVRRGRAPAAYPSPPNHVEGQVGVLVPLDHVHEVAQVAVAPPEHQPTQGGVTWDRVSGATNVPQRSSTAAAHVLPTLSDA